MPQRSTSGITNELELHGMKFEEVDKFCYVGDMLADKEVRSSCDHKDPKCLEEICDPFPSSSLGQPYLK